MSNKRFKLSLWCWFVLFICVVAIVNVGILYLLVDETPNQIDARLWTANQLRDDRGYLRKVFTDDDGTVHRYVVFVPHEMKASDRTPLLLYLNGVGKNGDDGISPLLDGIAPAIWERQRDFPFVVVWPQCPKGAAWGGSGKLTDRALAILRQTMTEYHIDPDRIYLSGVSSGGSGVWSIAAKHPDLFAAIVPVSSPGVNAAEFQHLSAANLPIWTFSVEADDTNLVEFNRQIHQRFLNEGLSPHHTELPTNQHGKMDVHDAWSFAYRNFGLYRWLLAQNRSERLQDRQRYTSMNPASVPSKVVCERPADHNGAGSAPLLTELSAFGMTDLHLEFRTTEGIQRFGVGFFTSQNSELPTGELVDLPIRDLGCGGIYSWPQNRCLHPAFAAGEQALLGRSWNDLRLRFSQGRLTVELNGWLLLDEANVGVLHQDAVIGFVAQGDAGKHVELRNIRFRQRPESKHPNIQAIDNQNKAAQSTFRSDTNAPSDSVEMAAIVSAWKQREELFPSVHLRWTQESETESTTSSVRTSIAPSTETTLDLTPDSVNYKTSWQHLRMDLTRKAGLSGNSSPQDFLNVLHSHFTSKTGKPNGSLHLDVRCDDQRRIDEIYGSDNRGHRGIVFNRPDIWRDRVDNLDDAFWRGPLLAFRPLSRQGIGCQADACRVWPQKVWIAGISCFIVEETTHDDNREFVRRFWVDPQRDFLILRASLTVDGMFREQLDVHYTMNTAHQWLPASWNVLAKRPPASSTSDRYFAGNELLLEHAGAKVVDCVVDDTLTRNPPTSGFRPGSVIFDQSTNEWSQQIGVDQRRKLEMSEVMALTVGDHAESPSSSLRTWISGGGIGLLIVACGVALRRRRAS